MAAAPQEAGGGRTPGYPYIPEETWWRIRKLFQDKGAPKPAWNENYVVNMGLRGNEKSARNLVRPFTRMGLFNGEGKATPRFWDWIDDAKYPEVCEQLLHELYPDELTHVFTDVDDGTRDRLEKWFQRNQGVAPGVANQYATLYMLLVEADPSKQNGAATPRASRTPKATAPKSSGSQSRSSRVRAQADSAASQQAHSAGVEVEQNGHDSAESRGMYRVPLRGIEPSLNINIQIHISAEATPEQIDQIFKSMAKHLY